MEICRETRHSADGGFDRDRALSMDEILKDEGGVSVVRDAHDMGARISETEQRSVVLPAFSDADAGRLFGLLSDFPRIHYYLMLERGLAAPSQRPFSPREREVVHHLLGPMREAEIAESLGVSKGSTRSYITEVYRVLQVKSRHEMMQLWLGEVPRA